MIRLALVVLVVLVVEAGVGHAAFLPAEASAARQSYRPFGMLRSRRAPGSSHTRAR